MGAKKKLHLRYQVQNTKTSRMEVRERDVTLDIPAGIDSGMNLRPADQEAEGDPRAPQGNLIVQVVIDDDEYFQRDGTNVHTEYPISLTQAVLGGGGGRADADGGRGDEDPGGHAGELQADAAREGVPHLDSVRRKDNHIVPLQIEIPKGVSRRQEELLREFDEEMGRSKGGLYGRLSEAAGSVFEKVFGHGDDAKSKDEGQENDGEDDDSDDETNEKRQQTA